MWGAPIRNQLFGIKKGLYISSVLTTPRLDAGHTGMVWTLKLSRDETRVASRLHNAWLCFNLFGLTNLVRSGTFPLQR